MYVVPYCSHRRKRHDDCSPDFGVREHGRVVERATGTGADDRIDHGHRDRCEWRGSAGRHHYAQRRPPDWRPTDPGQRRRAARTVSIVSFLALTTSSSSCRDSAPSIVPTCASAPRSWRPSTARWKSARVSETITVTGESPTVDVRSNVQQTVMNQEILEGIPTGRDPWSLAKLIPGVQVATYDVGGTQSMQQSSMSAHGSSTADVSYNIDGATVNWPGGGGGATMIYYDQGMFEEVNYMTSAIPAEQLAGGVSINMVTKDGGNHVEGQRPLQLLERRAAGLELGRHRGSRDEHQSRGRRSSATRPRRPTTSTSPAAARWSRTSCGSTARSASGSSTSSSTPRTPTAARRSTTTT